ncbi:MAG: TRAP transporter large permease subunit [Alphaproteobacteria bacterium]|nr:TRAP transporter large permease subunit [Alphaproteobacteria bacterium]MCB9931419.1 TRAP transporter large permease subunit [Alphaproteobacteria bacterium]
MDPIWIGIIAIVALLVLIGLRVPIGIALGSVSLVGLMFARSTESAFGIFGDLPFEFGASWSLSAVPMFLLMGSVAYHSGLTSSLYNAARLWLSALPGGLAVATNFASAGFAAASGSSLATSAAMGRLAIPEMLRLGYDKALAAGVVAASGTLGALIPPSIAFVLYGWFTETSIGALLIAGILPGLLTAFIYAGMIIIRCWLNPELAPAVSETVTWGQRWSALIEIWPVPLLILGVVGSIYGGIATPTEAGALGALIAIIIAFFQGRMTWQIFRTSVMEALESTAGIFFVAIGALLLTRLLAFSGVPMLMAEMIGDWAIDPLLLIIGLSIVYLILGMFLDPLGLMLLTLPVFLPMFEALKLDLIWVGVIVVKYIEIGLLTPPVGLNAYVVKSVVGDAIPLTTIFRGLAWFLAAEAVIMVLLIAFPEISLTLPNYMLN